MNLQASNELAREHQAMVAQYGNVQSRCSAVIAAQAAEIAKLQAQSIRLRAAAMVRETALAWEREDRQAMEDAIPGLPKRLTLARRVESLVARVHDLMRERLGWQKRLQQISNNPPGARYGDLREKSVLCVGEDLPGASVAQQVVELAGGHFLHHGGQDGQGRGGSEDGEGPEEDSLLEASLAAADLVICQAGCVSHNAYWRVQDHCRRTGKQCVLVEQPHAMKFVRGRGFAVSQPPTEQIS